MNSSISYTDVYYPFYSWLKLQATQVESLQLISKLNEKWKLRMAAPSFPHNLLLFLFTDLENALRTPEIKKGSYYNVSRWAQKLCVFQVIIYCVSSTKGKFFLSRKSILFGHAYSLWRATHRRLRSRMGRDSVPRGSQPSPSNWRSHTDSNQICFMCDLVNTTLLVLSVGLQYVVLLCPVHPPRWIFKSLHQGRGRL